jgi:hypothetical protein
MNKNTGYVTNSTANSISFYAMAFLNNQGYSPERISKMRKEFSLENLDYGSFTFNELKTCFAKQSAYFLNLYAHLNENDRFKHFANDLQKQNRFFEIFKEYKDASHLNSNYDRKIFHNHLDCKYMRKDYEEEDGYHPNTGVFHVDSKNKQENYYILELEYLAKIGMKLCNTCYNLDFDKIPIELSIKEGLGDYKGALNDYNKLIVLNPTLAIAYYCRGICKNKLKDTTGAYSDWTKAFELGATYAKELIRKNCI